MKFKFMDGEDNGALKNPHSIIPSWNKIIGFELKIILTPKSHLWSRTVGVMYSLGRTVTGSFSWPVGSRVAAICQLIVNRVATITQMIAYVIKLLFKNNDMTY